jgi:predicted nucleic acid-binding protein
MAGLGPSKRLAVDTNLLFDLAAGCDYAHDFRERFQRAGYSLLAGSTVFQELAYAGLHEAEPKRSQARQAVANAANWDIVPFELSSLEKAIAERFANRLLSAGMIANDEWNDALILAESSVAEIPLLVTSDKHLLDVDEDTLLLLFNEADLSPVRIAHPKGLLRALG